MTPTAPDTPFIPKKSIIASFTEELQQQYYPELQSRLASIGAELQRTEEWLSAVLLTLGKLKQEFNLLFEKEQNIILPSLSLLEQQNQKTDCKLFKQAKTHYTAALQLIQHLKACLASKQEASLAVERIKDMEQIFIQQQKDKERLFNSFKDCTKGCKIYEQK